MTTVTPEERLERDTLVMGDELGQLYYHLNNEYCWLLSKWNEYNVLFGSSQERIDILNRKTGQVFNIFQDTLWENVILHIARLTDRPTMRRNRNLSLLSIPQLVDSEIKENSERVLQLIIDQSIVCRQWRNKRIAHKDLALLLSETDELGGISRKNISDISDLIAEYINILALHYHDTTIFFDTIDALTGGESLLFTLRDGIRRSDEKTERLRSGVLTDQDLKNDPI